MKLLCFILLSVSYSGVNLINCPNAEEHYWRDYTGNIPCDAIPGGFDISTNSTTYIGLALHRSAGLLIPGEIDAISRLIRYEYGFRAETDTVDVKILCTKHLNEFQWIPAKLDEEIFKILKGNMTPIVASYEHSTRIYIGREIPNPNRVAVGKVGSANNRFRFLHVSANGDPESLRTSFEVLVHDPLPKIDKELHCKIINIYN